MTAPQQVGYLDLLRVWQEIDRLPQIEHACLFDQLMPIAGDPNGPAFERWTLLTALASRPSGCGSGCSSPATESDPALLAKTADTVDNISDGRLNMGTGVGSRQSPPAARREYPAHGHHFKTSPMP